MNSNQIATATICTGLIIAANLLPISARATSKPKSKSFTTIGKVLNLTNGDSMCYVEVYAHGNSYNIGADFEICSQTKFLNKQVQLTYKRSPVSDCPSSEPCGKTRIENLIVKMKLVPQ